MADQTIDFLLPSDDGLSLTTGTRFTIRVRPGLRAFRAELEDVLFHFNSAVMLPEAPRPVEPDTLPPRQPFTGLDAIAAALAHAVLHPERKLLVTGHTDTVGSDSDNVALSNLRSRNVLALLVGDKADWVKTADSRHKTEDYQQILKWAAVQRQWPTDPGDIDGQDGPKTQEALKNLQSNYNVEFKQTIAEDGKIGTQTWGAIFDLYQDYISTKLQADADKMDSIRKGLAFVDAGKKQVGCGEHFPIQQKDRDNFKSQTNRRVEILFFDPEPEKQPLLACHASANACDKEKCDLYGKNRFIFVPIPEDFANGPVKITLEYDDGQPMGLADFEAHFGETIVEGTTEADGTALIIPPPGAGATFLLKLIAFPESFV